jgi:hypothetical protein
MSNKKTNKTGKRGSPVGSSRKPVELGSLAQMLHRHHPDAVPDPDAFIARARAEQTALALSHDPQERIDEEFEVEMERRARAAAEPKRTSEEVLDDFVGGRGALATIGAVACADELQATFKEEVLALRAALVRKFGSDADVVMVADVAAAAFFEARHFGTLARTVLKDGLDENRVKRALRLEEMSSRAHRRALIALEVLRRPQNASVKVEIHEAKNVAVGEQKLELPT